MPCKRASPTHSNDVLKASNPHLSEILKSSYRLHLNYYSFIRPQYNLLSKHPLHRITPYHNPRAAFIPTNYTPSPTNNTIILNRFHLPNTPNLHNLHPRPPFPHHRSSLQIQHRHIYPPSHPHYRTPPHLDYFLLNQLINLVHPHLTKHQFKRIEYIIDARRSFYEGHEKFQIAYRDLLDAYAYAEMLDGEVERLRCLLKDTITATAAAAAATGNDDDGVATLQKRLDALEIQRRSNKEDMRTRLERLQTRTKLRSHISLWYSDLKFVFVRDEMPWLIELAKQKCGGAIEREGIYMCRTFLLLWG